MEAATKLGLPWRLLREKLAPPDPDTPATDVNYKKTLEMLETDLIVSLHLISGVLSNLFFPYFYRKLHMLDQHL